MSASSHFSFPYNKQSVKPDAIKLKPLSILMSMMLVSACATSPQQTQDSAYPAMSKQSAQDEDTADDLEELLSASDMQAVESNRVDVLRYGDMWQRMRAGFGLDLTVWNRRIEAQKNWFTARQPYISRLSARASRYLYYTVAEAERRGIPTELALLPVIESSYDPTATSNAKAAGMWQFIPSTGRIYGLRQTATYDGRRDVIESTRAAYDFLTSLYNKFGSWELALAAYNCGPGCVNKAIKKNRRRGRATDYWSLKLPKETMDYVPRFLAVAQIVQRPEQYGIHLPSIANRPHFRSVPIQGGVELTTVSRVSGLGLEELYDLNPALSQGVTDIDGPNRLLVPTSMSYKYDNKISELQGYGYSAMAQVDSKLPVQVLNRDEAERLMTSGRSGTTQVGKTASVIPKNTTGDGELTAADRRTKFYKNKVTSLPNSPTGLAEFVANARVPNQNMSYIQPKVAPDLQGTMSESTVVNQQEQVSERTKSAKNVTSAKTDAKAGRASQALDNVTETEKQQLQTKVLADINALPTSAAQITKNETVLQYPAINQQERQRIIAEIKKADPTANVIDPVDGQIKLEAIQTQQSVLAAQGKSKKLTFDAPVKKPKKVVKKLEKPKGKRTIYKVKSGDTLKKIGERFGLGWRDIANWNQINPSASLYVGTPLYLYGATPPKPKPKPTSYQVQVGDTMIGVANQFGISPSQLARLNDMKALDNLIVGQTLSLVESESTASTLTNSAKQQITAKPSSKKTKVYKVQSGEGLIQLAKRFGMSTDELASLNSISSTKDLFVGQKLKVPVSTQTTPSKYKVQSGDTMIGVANKFGLSASQLAKRNGMKALDNLVVGQTLNLVDSVGKKQVETSTKTKNQKSTKKETQKKTQKKPTSYVVESGDTMIYVARKFKLSTNKLAKLNGMKPTDDLRIGQRLTLVDDGKSKNTKVVKNSKKTDKNPNKKPSKKPTSYVVESGDTMIYVARKFGLSTNNLAKWNGMKPTDNLIIGKRMTLVNNGKPSSKSSKQPSKNKSSKKESSKKKPKYTSYKVKAGDGLIALARKHGISTAELAKLNKMKPTDSLQLGKTIKVPAK